MDKIVEYFKDEIDGYHDYMATANSETDHRIKQMFINMANQELEHAKNLYQISKKVQDYVNSIDEELQHLQNIKQLYNRIK